MSSTLNFVFAACWNDFVVVGSVREKKRLGEATMKDHVQKTHVDISHSVGWVVPFFPSERVVVLSSRSSRVGRHWVSRDAAA
jgi:hypothetical protein